MQLADVRDGKLSDDNIMQFYYSCGESMIVAALNLLDHRDGKPFTIFSYSTDELLQSGE